MLSYVCSSSDIHRETVLIDPLFKIKHFTLISFIPSPNDQFLDVVVYLSTSSANWNKTENMFIEQFLNNRILVCHHSEMVNSKLPEYPTLEYP